MLDIRAYCDESETAEHFVLAGAMASSATWERLSSDWTSLLAQEGLHEFHAHDCVQGDGEYAERDNDDRQRLLRQFLVVIQSHMGINGVGVALEMKAWPHLVSALAGC